MFEFLDSSFQILNQTRALAFLLGGTIIFSLFLFITARVPYWIRLIGIPIILALTIFAYAQLDDILGYPYWGVPTEEALLLGYDVQRKHKGELEIVIWVREKEGSRLYFISWSKEREERLKQAMEGMKKGRKYGIIRGDDDMKGINDGDFVLHEFRIFQYPKKVE